MKNTLPDYINCNSKAITHCDFYMHNDCPETCAYAKSIGVGATDQETVKRINNNLDSLVNRGNLWGVNNG